MKIELKHLAPYLPYGLKVQYEGIINGKEISQYDKDFRKNNPSNDDWLFDYKPITEIKGLKIAEIKELKLYKGYWKIYAGVYRGGLKSFYNGIGFKPLLRPLSGLYKTDGFSLSKMITHGYHNSFWGKEKFSVNHLYYHDLLILLEWHFDVYGLIEQGLAIDINTLTPTTLT